MRRVGFEFQINYHSAAELLLYGVGWQVATRSPDDLIYEALGRRRRQPGGARLRPGHRRRALHHQRRDHRARPRPVRHARLHAGDVDLRRRRAPSTRTTRSSPATARASSTSRTPRPLMQAEFEKNIPFALVGRRSRRRNPAHPVSAGRPDRAGLRGGQLRRLLRRPADRRGHRAARAARPRGCTTRSTGGTPRPRRRREWRGGERYGDEARHLLRRVPRRGARRQAGRPGRRSGSPAAEARARRRAHERAVHLPAGCRTPTPRCW